jgi:hypothetical protein
VLGEMLFRTVGKSSRQEDQSRSLELLLDENRPTLDSKLMSTWTQAQAILQLMIQM